MENKTNEQLLNEITTRLSALIERDKSDKNLVILFMATCTADDPANNILHVSFGLGDNVKMSALTAASIKDTPEMGGTLHAGTKLFEILGNAVPSIPMLYLSIEEDQALMADESEEKNEVTDNSKEII